jgi:hypothetical protein
MSRAPVATVGGLLFFTVYIVAAVNLADYFIEAHWALQFFYFLIAGAAWVMPVRWIMLWSVHKR